MRLPAMLATSALHLSGHRHRQIACRPGTSLGSTFLAFKKQITDCISQSAAPSIVLNMFNAQEQA